VRNRLILLAALLLAVVVSGRCPLQASVPELVIVDLFEAHAPVKAVLVEGPLEVRTPLLVTMPAGLYRISASSGTIELSASSLAGVHPGVGAGEKRSGVRGQRVTGARLVLCGRTEKGLRVLYAGALARHYRGKVVITLRPDGNLRLRNQLPVQQYVEAVVGSETFSGWPAEALKAQAILTQTRLARYRPGDPLGDSTQTEAYLGSDYERPQVTSAVACVWGQILTWDGRPILPMYHSTCAGRTSSGELLFGRKAQDMPYLKSIDCSYCQRSPFWTKTRSVIPGKRFDRCVDDELPEVVARDAADRPLSVKMSSAKRLTGYQFWILVGQKLGWDKMPGTHYWLSRLADGSIALESRGAGHGVGLCQWGAAQQARLGKSCSEILRYYFPGTQISRR